MSDLSVIGAPPSHKTASNLFEFIFSNPYRRDGPVAQHAPTKETQSHVIPIIPPHKPLLVNPISSAQISWQRTRTDALRIAAGLRALGIHPSPSVPLSPTSHAPIISPVVLLHLPNSLPYAPLLFGIFASGLTATMANPALTSGELAWILKNAEPQVIITTPEGQHIVRKAIMETESPKVKASLLNTRGIFTVDPTHDDYGLSGTTIKPQTHPDSQDWKALLAPKPLDEAMQFNSNEYKLRTAIILWSSGTSGKSKGVMLSHQAVISNMPSLWHINPKFDGEQRWLGFAPFYHIFALTNVLLLAAASGATVLVMPKFDPRMMLDYVQRFRVTFLHMAPPVAVILAKSPMLDEYDVSSVQGAMSGGAPLPPEVIEQVYNRLKILIKLGYGLSEAGSVCNQIGDTWDVLKPQLGSTGIPCPGVELKIISTEDATKVVKKGQEGEILIRTPANMTCYLNNKTATDEALDTEGWFHTGDVGKIDDKGQVWITDRLKDVIKVKGFQVSPSDLENILCGSDDVADAAVTGIFDPAQATELPKAYVVPANKSLLDKCVPGGSLTPELRDLGLQLKKLVEGKTIRYKWLTGNIVFVQAVPKSPSGKILRRLLKDCKGVDMTLYETTRREKAKL